MDNNNNEYYIMLCNKYDVLGRFFHFFVEYSEIIAAMGYEEYVRIDENLLGKAVIDYFEDIDRLKKYEGINRICTSKIYGYGVYWLMKRKPLQIIRMDCSDERILYVNEIACTTMIISKMFKEMGIVEEKSDELLMNFFNLLFYNFKYRLFTQKSLELMIEAFFLAYTRE